MTRLKDGCILNSNLAMNYGGLQSSAGMHNTQRLVIGQITEVLYIDHPRNRSKRFVEYDIVINDAGVTTSNFKNCRRGDTYGDENNFNEDVLQPCTVGKRGKTDNTEATAYRNGANVLVGFIGGQKESPVIICGLQHPHINLQEIQNRVSEFAPVGSSTSRDSRMAELPTLPPGSTSTGDNGGQRILGEFQGLRWNINKDGELTVIYQGPKDPQGNLTSPANQPTTIKINKEGELLLIDNLDQEIKISRKDQKIYISSGNTDPDFIEIDRANKNITIDCGNDEIHMVGNDTNTTVGRNEVQNVKKESNISVGQNQKFKVGKIWTVDAGKQTVIVAPKVTVGGVGAAEPLVLGNLFKTLFNNLVSVFNDHKHNEHDFAGDPGAITAAPNTSAASMTAAQLSDFCFTRKNYVGK